ncbi:MAG: site-2 protease family protein [Bacillota bacterium]|nr:site-2 protease family protein [Bacillota bacterium]
MNTANSFSDVIRGLDFGVLTDIIFAVIPALICITLHELSHGFVAYKLGDNTAKNMGRLTLNPIKHIDLFGLVMMVVFKFGWAKPVPVDMRNFKNPKRDMAITALAGPVSNIVIGCVFLFVYGLVYVPCLNSASSFSDAILETVYVTAYLSFALAVFNIVPVPPLDGSKVLFSLMSDSAYMKLMRYERYGMIALLILVATGALGNPLQKGTMFLVNKFMFFAEWGFSLFAKLM